MPCYRPLKGYRSRLRNPKSGKRGIVFSAREGYTDEPIDLPCGQCIGCRLERSRQWACRAVHEASLYDRNCFVTLTYSDEHLPANGSLDYDAPVLWMKRLRDRFGAGIRSFGCAEYGEKFRRPHYHVCLFNFDFDDKVLFKRSGGFDIFTSDALSETWGLGHCTVGALTFESAAYVARYCTKKVTGDRAEEHYFGFNPDTGECFQRAPERSVCVSRRPGLGRPWYEKFGGHSRAHDFVVLRGMKMRPPSYYDRLFDLNYPSDFAKKKAQRKARALHLSKLEAVVARNLAEANSRDRLSIREEVHEFLFQLLKRGMENG